MLLPFARIVGQMTGRVKLVIKALCEHKDMGDLSLVVVAVASAGDYWWELIALSTI
jgi:hypothetical protein